METIRSYWRGKYSLAKADLLEILKQDLFENWSRVDVPETVAEGQFRYGLLVLLGHGDSSLAKRFLRRAQQVAERVLEEKRKRQEFTVPQCMRVREYSKLLQGLGWDTSRLGSAGEALCRSALKEEGRDWDDYVQACSLAGVRLLLLAERYEEARRIVAIRRSYACHKSELSVIRTLVGSEEIAQHRLSAPAAVMLREFFDAVREPLFKTSYYSEPEFLRLDYSALVSRLLNQQGVDVDGGRLIDALIA